MFGFLQTLESRLPIVEQFSVLTELNTILSTLSKSNWVKRMLIPSAVDHSGVGRILGVSLDPSFTSDLLKHLMRILMTE